MISYALTGPSLTHARAQDPRLQAAVSELQELKAAAERMRAQAAAFSGGSSRLAALLAAQEAQQAAKAAEPAQGPGGAQGASA